MFCVNIKRIMEKEKALKLRNIIEDIKKSGLSEKYIKELYSILGYDGIKLYFTNMGVNTAAFNPKYNTISVNMDKTESWINEVLKDSKTYFDFSDEELAKSYLLVSLLCHEIEHSHQKLIADSKVKPNYDYKTQVFRDMFNIMQMKKYIVPRPISLLKDIILFGLYTKNAYNFILERNASVEGYNTASEIADISLDTEMLDYLITSRNAYMMQGYMDNGDGTLKYTYDTLGLMNKYNKLILPTDISLQEKAREGLPLDESDRTKVLLSLKKSSKFK